MKGKDGESRGGVVVLAGGTGGAKLAAGIQDVVGPERLAVIANPGDDTERDGAYVCPDADLIAFWLADLIDERGWGLRDDSFAAMDGLRALGREIHFNLGDRDLALGIERANRLQAGERLTDANSVLFTALGLHTRVLPATDQPLRTRVLSGGRWWEFQEFMIRGAGKAGGELVVDDVELRGARAARPTAEALAAIADAAAIVIGPSNPVISIGPILAIPGIREALRRAQAPVIAVSPIVGGAVLKGPTAAFMTFAGQPISGNGVATLYEGVIDGIVLDDPIDRPPIDDAPVPDPSGARVPSLRTELLMDTRASRRELARATLEFASALAR